MGNQIDKLCCCLDKEQEQPSGLKLFHYEIWFRDQIRKGKIKPGKEIMRDPEDTGGVYQRSEIR